MRLHSLSCVTGLALCVAATGCSACSKKVRETALHQYALDLCGKMQHKSGSACRQDVESKFPRCSPSFLAQESSSEQFAECLGFALPAPSPQPAGSTVIGRCDAPHISAKISVSLAKSAPWDGSALRELEGKSWYVSNTPTITTSDLRSLRLEEQDGQRMVAVEVSPEAAGRLEEVTGSNVGNSMVLALNDSVVVPRIASSIPGPKLVIMAPDAKLEDVCQKQ